MGRLQGASLFDLVQLECLAGLHHVVRVISGEHVGYLFFDQGNLVHATTGQLQGEPAALAVLGWKDGLFEPCQVAWPKVPTITKQWQNLLLLAAQTSDEMASDDHDIDERWDNDEPTGAKVLEFPNDRVAEVSSHPPPQRGPHVSNDPFSREHPDSTAISAVLPNTAASVAPPPRSKPASTAHSGVQAAVRLDASGNVLTSRGDGETLIGPVAYALRVAHLVAESLGLGEVRSLECEAVQRKTLVYREPDGQVVALTAGQDMDMSQLRQKAGL
jgi:hypothetical protein